MQTQQQLPRHLVVATFILATLLVGIGIVMGAQAAASAPTSGGHDARVIGSGAVGYTAPLITATPTRTPTGTPPPACGLYWRLVASPNPGSYTISYGVGTIATNDVWRSASTLMALRDRPWPSIGMAVRGASSPAPIKVAVVTSSPA